MIGQSTKNLRSNAFGEDFSTMIRVEKLTKDYGPTRALDGISFEVKDRQILGFLGPNGAGKSTAMKVITTYLAPTDGQVTVEGHDVTKDPIGVRRKIGYLPETNPLYTDMRVDDFLDFCGQARGLRGNTLASRRKFVVEACGLGRVLKKNIIELSKGFKQRTGLAQALIHDPKILILDEPTSGLDPLQIIEIRSLIQQLAQEKTIIFSTHILQEVSSTTDRVIIINNGKIIADGFISEIRRDLSDVTQVRAALGASRDSVERELAAISGVEGVSLVGEVNGSVTVELRTSRGQDVMKSVGELAVKNQWAVHELSSPTLSLEDAFIELVRRQTMGKEARHG